MERKSMSDVNPYEPPQASVDAAGQVGEDDWLLMDPQRCEAGRGWGWIADGFRLFAASPGIWIVNFVLFGVIMLVISIIPLVSIVGNILGPIFVAGFMLGARELDQFGELKVEHLFAGFRENAGKLAGLGAMTIAISLGIVIVMVVFMMAVIGGAALSEAAEDPTLLGVVLIPVILMALALSVPMMMAYWFAPALVVLHDVGVFEALKLSFIGCLRNLGPFLIYGLIMFVVMLVAIVPVFLGLLVASPVLLASMYVGYREVFTRPPQATFLGG
jgi:hypothetical protein